MATLKSRTTCLISHRTDLSELDFIVQNIEFSLRTKGVRVHGILSPFSQSYSSTLKGLQRISKKLKSVYGLKCLIVDISTAGDIEVVDRIRKSKLSLRENGIYSNREGSLNYLLLKNSIENMKVSLMENFLFQRTLEEAKISHDILFILPSLKNPNVVRHLELNPEVQWLFLEKKHSEKTYKKIKENPIFQAPFMGIVTI